jgi:hypothetical protein
MINLYVFFYLFLCLVLFGFIFFSLKKHKNKNKHHFYYMKSDEHWELITHMLPYTTKDSLKYKWISLKKDKACDNLWNQEDDMLLMQILRYII